MNHQAELLDDENGLGCSGGQTMAKIDQILLEQQETLGIGYEAPIQHLLIQQQDLRASGIGPRNS